MPGPDSPDPVLELTQRCTDVLEMYVRRHPELWLWMHRRWRDDGPGAAEERCAMFPVATRDTDVDPNAPGGGELTVRVAVAAPNWLGDAVMALGTLGDLRRAFPEDSLAVAARRSLTPLFRSVQGVDEVIEWHGAGGVTALSRWREDAERLSARQADIAVLLPNSFASAWVARRAGIP